MAKTRKIPKETIINDINDLKKLTKAELVILSDGMLNTIRNMNSTQTLPSGLENAIISTHMNKQIVIRNQHDLERQRLFTILDIINNTKALLESSSNEFKHGSIYKLEDDALVTTSNVIRTCLEQLDTWLKNNNINKINLKDYEKITKNSNDIVDGINKS